MGSAANMARSLLVVLALVAALVAIVPRTAGVTAPPVDAAAVAGAAVASSGVAFEVPVGLAEGWAATSARYAAGPDSVPTWQGVWTTPTGQHVSLKQAAGATPAWLEAVTNQAGDSGEVSLAGRQWRSRIDARGQTSLVSVSPQGLTTVLSTTGDLTDLGQFAAALRPAASRPDGRSASG